MRAFALFLCAFALAVTSAFGGVVYSTNFESGAGAEWSGGGSVQTAGGLSAFGFGQNHWRNDGSSATVLTLGGLAPHSLVTLTFNLALWDSIDIGDLFTVQADALSLFSSTEFGNYFPPDDLGRGPGTLITPAFTAFAVPDYGYNSGFRDSARRASFTFAHTAATLQIIWQYPSTQGGLDESFGIDNVIVETDAQSVVPEPSTMLLFAAGLGLAGLARRRK
ncbi:MAG TPA: PEP-CTERM sorting domain-containing protein [Solibacterales bacterium]|nr:PEP-CTERM sorting domain-containing protein [Bryobacterales bacterium]